MCNRTVRIRDGIMEHFLSAKFLFVLKRYDIANASICRSRFAVTGSRLRSKHKNDF